MVYPNIKSRGQVGARTLLVEGMEPSMAQLLRPGNGQETVDDKGSVMKIVIGLTHNCNLACTYCYAGSARRRNISLDTAQRAVDFGFEISAPDETLEFGFFGGEPLLCADRMRSISRYIRSCARDYDRSIKLSVTTNGTLLSPSIVKLLREQDIRLCISLDGLQSVHDRHRRRKDGGPTYANIVDNLNRAMDELDYLQVNTVFTPDSIEELAAGVSSLLDLGVAVLHVNPDICANWSKASSEMAWSQFDQIAQLYIDAFTAGNEIGINIIDSKVLVLLKGGYGRLDRCAMARSQWAVAPSGNLYPCERFIGDDADSPFCMGNVHTGIDVEQRNGLLGHTDNRNPECEACSLRAYCMNWCGCTNYYLSGKIDYVNLAQCIFERAAIRAATTVLTELSARENERFIDHYMGYLEDHETAAGAATHIWQ